MGTSGRGNIIHIDNTYVKPINVADNVKIELGDYCLIIEESGEAVVRPLLAADFSADDTFLVLTPNSVVIAGEEADNLDLTDESLRKAQCTCILRGTDWEANTRAGILPEQIVGLLRVDGADEVFQISHFLSNGTTPVISGEVLGTYKTKSFTSIARISQQDDLSIIQTGAVI